MSESGSVTATLSPFAQLLKNQQQLERQDPTAFQQRLANTANQLTALAQQQSPGSDFANFLKYLAAKFQSAAQSGDLSALSAGQGRHHHHRAQAAYQ